MGGTIQTREYTRFVFIYSSKQSCLETMRNFLFFSVNRVVATGQCFASVCLLANCSLLLFRTVTTTCDYSWTAIWFKLFLRASIEDGRRFGWAVWHSCRMGARNQEQTRGRIGPQLRLGNLRVGELHFCPLCTALDQASSLSRKLAYVPGPTFGFVKLLASSNSHCIKWADEQHRQAGFESRFVPDLPSPLSPL